MLVITIPSRIERTFKEAMKVIKNEPGTQTEKLARFLLSYLTTPLSASGCPLAKKNNGEMTANKARIAETRFVCTD